LGVDRFGRACYDVDHAAHTRYGISTAEGAVVVLRPDGMLAFADELDQGVDDGKYLDAIVPSHLVGGRGAYNLPQDVDRFKSCL
jgi:phenol 2-monooxygenase